MTLERSIQGQAQEASPIVRNTLELARYAMDIGGILLRAVWAGLSDPPLLRETE